MYFPVAVARNVFGAPDASSPLYQQGQEWAGVCFGAYSLVCFLFAFWLPVLAKRVGRKATHAICLLCGAAGLASVAVIHEPKLLLLSMAGVGIPPSNTPPPISPAPRSSTKMNTMFGWRGLAWASCAIMTATTPIKTNCQDRMHDNNRCNMDCAFVVTGLG